MPLDAVCLRAVVQELEPSVVNARWIRSISPPGMRSSSHSGAERER